MTQQASDNAPVDLGTAVAPDPFWVQPGVIVLERFCVIGHVRHTAEIWRVPVTDLRRELGAPPNHRFDLQFLPVPVERRTAVRAVLGFHQSGVHRLEAVVEVEHGLVLLVTPADLPPLAHPLRHDDAFTLARTLCAILVAAHRAGVVGVRFDARDLRIDAQGELQFASWRHLLPLRFDGGANEHAEADVRALIDLLCTLGNATIERSLQPGEGRSPSTSAAADLRVRPLESATALAERLAAAVTSGGWQPPAAVLPAIAPFVGRDAELLAVHQAVARAHHAGPEAFFVTGAPGSGRSRLLDELALEFGRGAGLLAIQTRFRRAAPYAGLGVLLSHVADALALLPKDELKQCVARMLQATGSSAALVASVSPKLHRFMTAPSDGEALPAELAPAPVLPLDEDFIRRSAAAAELVAAIGTARRPLVLLLDDLHLSDASSQAVLYHLLTPGRRHHLVVVFTGSATSLAGLPRPPTVLELAPWSAPTIGALLRLVLPGPLDAAERVAARLAELTAGVPVAVWRRVQAWVELGVLARDREGRWVLDDRAAAHSNVLLLPSSWSSVPPAARRVALLLAIRADPVTPGWLASVTGWDRPPIKTAVATLIERGVVLQDPGGRLAFSDETTRQRMIDDASVLELRETHATLAAWLAQVDGSVAQRAWHREHASLAGADQALADLHLAAGKEHLALSNAERAAWHYECALARSDRSSTRTAALKGRAHASLLQDRTAEALEDYLAAMAELPPVGALTTANHAVHAFYLRGAHDAALALARAALGTCGERLPRGLGAALVDVLRAVTALTFRRRWSDEAVADELALLHSTLVASVAASHPHIGLSSLFRGLAATVGRASGPASRARAFFSVLPAAAGLKSVARRLVDTAEQQARSDHNPLYLGVVYHFRGQNELGFGNYAAGQEAFREGVEAFRLAGDLSVAVISMALATFYALDREPVAALLARIDEAEATAWRQRNTAVLPGIRGMRLWVLARAGRLDAREVEAQADEIAVESSDLLGAVVGESLTALALTHVGRPSALERAVRARTFLDRATARPPFLEIALLAEAAAQIAGGELADATRAVARLRKRARRVAGLRVAVEVVRARHAARSGDLPLARELLARVVEDLPAHQETWHALDAHRALAELLAGREPLASRGHAVLAQELAARLGVVTAGAARAEAEPAPMPAALQDAAEPAPRPEVAMWELVDVLEPTIRRAFPANFPIRVSVDAGVKTIGHAETVELLVVNLALAARDSVGQAGSVQVNVDEAELAADDAARMRDAKPGRWARVRVATLGSVGPATLGALRECRCLCTELSGFLEVDEDGSTIALMAYLPAPEGSPHLEPAPSELVVVIHRDEGVRRSLLDGITRFGCTAVALPPGDALPDECSLVFVEGALRHLVTAMDPRRTVAVVRRGHPPGDEVQLAVPYLVHELDGLLTRQLAAASPNGAAPRSG